MTDVMLKSVIQFFLYGIHFLCFILKKESVYLLNAVNAKFCELCIYSI